MPTYDYLCNRGHITESQQGVDVESIPCCCGRPAQRQAVYPVQFKGRRDPNCPGDFKNKQGKYRVSVWQEQMAEQREKTDAAL